jgi:predicted nuclease of predicted toxin-antitoxin system
VSDDEVWAHARKHGFAIVTKDEDFNNFSVVRGSPPKVIWLQLGNCTTSQVEGVFRARFDEVVTFEQDDSVGTLVLS